LIRLVQIR